MKEIKFLNVEPFQHTHEGIAIVLRRAHTLRFYQPFRSMYAQQVQPALEKESLIRSKEKQ
jgi:hypothetical protein